MTIEKTLTDNPYVDELVYYTKQLAYDCVLKNEQQALLNETADSRTESGIYMACKSGYASIYILNFTEPILHSAGLDATSIKEILEDKNVLLDTSKFTITQRDNIINIASNNYISNYIEHNNYYRMLNGEPNIDEEGIKITDWAPPDGIIIDLTKYVHNMSSLEIEMLRKYGIIDNLITQYPTKEYLKHLYPKNISYYNARKAASFETLYLPTIDSKEIYDRFKERLDINREYTLKTIYSEAYKFGSDYYDSFIMVFIIIQTIVDMLSEIQEIIANKEILDLRCVQYIFESYGIPFYPDIPLKYQIKMVKNLNILLKYKSTSKNILDILGIFGFTNVEAFKYYLLKDRKVDENTNKYIFNYLVDGITEDNAKDFELKFVKVPLDNDNPDDYLKNKANYYNYDDITNSDDTWDGGLNHELVKGQILDRQFNYARTKYISIDTNYNVTELAFQTPYFFNMIFDDNRLEEQLFLYIPQIADGHAFKMTDIFAYLIALTYEYYFNNPGTIENPAAGQRILGFNFNVNMTEIENYVNSQNYTMQGVGLKDSSGNYTFKVPTYSIVSYSDLMSIFTNNGKILSLVVDRMMNADDKKEYDLYQYLYKNLMTMEFNNNYFRKSNGEVYSSYLTYLGDRDNVLSSILYTIHNITDSVKKIQNINEYITLCTAAVEEYIDSDQYKYIYANIPGASADTVKTYAYKVINFFKSYKVDFMGLSNIYRFDDKMDATIKIIDSSKISYTFVKRENINILDKMRFGGAFNGTDIGSGISCSKNETMNIQDCIYIHPYTE